MSHEEYHPPGTREIKGQFISIGSDGGIQNLSGKTGAYLGNSEKGAVTLLVDDQKINAPIDRLVKPRSEKDETA